MSVTPCGSRTSFSLAVMPHRLHVRRGGQEGVPLAVTTARCSAAAVFAMLRGSGGVEVAASDATAVSGNDRRVVVRDEAVGGDDRLRQALLRRRQRVTNESR